MSILKKMGLFINNQKVTDITADSDIEIIPKSINISNVGYVNHGNFNGNVILGDIRNSTIGSNISNSFNGKQHIQANSIGAVFGDNVNMTATKAKIIVDGEEFDISDFTTTETITIEIHGDINKIKCQNGNINATVSGDIGKITADTGNISVTGNVSGNITNQAGNITIQGDAAGRVSTQMGNIKKS